MSEEEKRYADRAFQWVMCAIHPLESKILLPAICQDESSSILEPLELTEDLALKYCHNLLLVDPVRKVWVPSHLSVIEYLEDHRWSQSQANCLVASVCLLLLQNTVLYNREEDWGNYTSVRDSSEDSPGPYTFKETQISQNELRDPLYEQGFGYFSAYARHHWLLHAKKSSGIDSKSRMSTLLEDFLGLPTESSLAYRCWHRMVSKDYRLWRPESLIFRYPFHPNLITPASMASFAYCAFDLAVILPDWYHLDWVKDDNRTDRGYTFLEITAHSRSIHTCRNLIKHGAEVNAQTESFAGSVLATAAYRGEKEVVEFLVKEGRAEIDMQLQNWGYGSALAAAACSGEKEVVELLVKEGAEVDMQLKYNRGYNGSALSAAASTGEKDLVEFLVKEGGADVNMQLENGPFGSALAAVAYGEVKEVVELLVKECGAKVNMRLKRGQYGSALAAAAYSGAKEVVEFLVKEGGADVNMRLDHGEYISALAAATVRGVKGTRQKELVGFLVAEGAVE